jgi:hypothetical protein
LDRHAYLADGTPLTEYDEDGRIVPASHVGNSLTKICSGGNLSLADRERGIAALARALDKGDLVRAPILLLQLQIDPAPALSKFNPNHKPAGPGGGQFTSASENDAVLQPADRSLGDNYNDAVWRPADGSLSHSDIEPVAQTMHVDANSTYQKGIYGDDADNAHDLVMDAVWLAILQVGSQNFRPSMPEYGTELHKAVAAIIGSLGNPNFAMDPVYLNGDQVPKGRPAGSSAPDIYYISPSDQLFIWELKTGKATNLQDPRSMSQKERALRNIPGSHYEYIQVYEK